MTRIRAAALASIVVAFVIACGASDIEASDYDQSCTVSEDCVLVAELSASGSECSVGCPRAAINKRAESRYKADFDESLGDCTSRRGAFCDVEDVASCVRGKCSVVPAEAGPPPVLLGDAG
jgi:hypothetical protein